MPHSQRPEAPTVLRPAPMTVHASGEVAEIIATTAGVDEMPSPACASRRQAGSAGRAGRSAGRAGRSSSEAAWTASRGLGGGVGDVSDPDPCGQGTGSTRPGP
jgi:hypothetical protein